jgi:hypothetical protein
MVNVVFSGALRKTWTSLKGLFGGKISHFRTIDVLCVSTGGIVGSTLSVSTESLLLLEPD